MKRTILFLCVIFVLFCGFKFLNLNSLSSDNPSYTPTYFKITVRLNSSAVSGAFVRLDGLQLSNPTHCCTTPFNGLCGFTVTSPGNYTVCAMKTINGVHYYGSASGYCDQPIDLTINLQQSEETCIFCDQEKPQPK